MLDLFLVARGGSAEGTFTFVKDQEYKLRLVELVEMLVDWRIFWWRNMVVEATESGGGGGGGGYTGLFEGSITVGNAIIIAAGGGGWI